MPGTRSATAEKKLTEGRSARDLPKQHPAKEYSLHGLLCPFSIWRQHWTGIREWIHIHDCECFGVEDGGAVLSVRAGGRTFHPRSFATVSWRFFFVWCGCLCAFVWLVLCGCAFCVFFLFVLWCCVVDPPTVRRSAFLDLRNPILCLISSDFAAQSLVSTLLFLCCVYGVASYADLRHFSHGLRVSCRSAAATAQKKTSVFVAIYEHVLWNNFLCHATLLKSVKFLRVQFSKNLTPKNLIVQWLHSFKSSCATFQSLVIVVKCLNSLFLRISLQGWEVGFALSFDRRVVPHHHPYHPPLWRAYFSTLPTHNWENTMTTRTCIFFLLSFFFWLCLFLSSSLLFFAFISAYCWKFDL